MRYFLLVSIAVLLMFMSGCRESRINATTTVIKGVTGTSVYPIERIFEIDGCNVYRFTDGDSISHFSTCPQKPCPTVVCPMPEPKVETKPHRHLQDEER